MVNQKAFTFVKAFWFSEPSLFLFKFYSKVSHNRSFPINFITSFGFFSGFINVFESNMKPILIGIVIPLSNKLPIKYITIFICLLAQSNISLFIKF